MGTRGAPTGGHVSRLLKPDETCWRTAHAGVALGASAGLFWAASDTAIKAQTGVFGQSLVDVFVSPL